MKLKPFFRNSLAFVQEQLTSDLSWTLTQYKSEILSEVFAKQFPGLTRADVFENMYIRQLWFYWNSPPIKLGSGRLAFAVDAPIWNEQFKMAAVRLTMLIHELSELVQVDESEVNKKYESYLERKRRVQDDQFKAIGHLIQAAIGLGYEPDHFIRKSVFERKYPRLDTESKEQYDHRAEAITIYEIRKFWDFVESKKQTPSLRTLALRAIWPILSIDVPTLKQLFTTENGAPRHAAALRSIVNMALPDLHLSTGYIKNFLSSVERDASL